RHAPDRCAGRLRRRRRGGGGAGDRSLGLAPAAAQRPRQPHLTMHETPVVLEVRSLTYRYGSGRPVLTDVSLTLREGEIVILSGPSGSGKSTLMSLVGLLRRPPPGNVRLFGIDAGSADQAGLLALRRRLRFIFQKHYL